MLQALATNCKQPFLICLRNRIVCNRPHALDNNILDMLIPGRRHDRSFEQDLEVLVGLRSSGIVLLQIDESQRSKKRGMMCYWANKVRVICQLGHYLDSRANERVRIESRFNDL